MFPFGGGSSRDTRTQETRPDGRVRLPPGQRLTEGWPVLHYGSIPKIDLATWELRVFGLVEQEVTLSWEQFMALPQSTDRSDIHCVTTWSRFDNDWAGVPFVDLQALARPLPEAQHVIFHSYGGYTTNVPLAELQARHTGVVLSARPHFRFDERAPAIRATRQGHWFWGPVLAQRFVREGAKVIVSDIAIV